ncbi:hypothetical protein J2Y69_002478 [Microbacterium resistens]|uniref:Uncharacterized protein n=1 Tax=Microbacterium resistens TaxID=156977 RepID=A0ABU1SE52_9MICO|nr:hypothetical protein [Microbacterium resistens]MDR6867870.1 hypothetical protein [Microbacterium resistens]
MSEFVDSKGDIRIAEESGEVRLYSARGAGGNMLEGMPWLCGGEVSALGEWFQKRRDEELGRWRWPEDPDFVVYPLISSRGAVRVLQESIGNGRMFVPAAVPDQSRAGRAADAYFAAHPTWKPWHDAKPGEFWSVHYHGAVEVCRVDGAWFVGVVMSVRMAIDDRRITVAHRMVPEVAS